VEPLRRDILSEMVANPQTLLVDSTLLSVLHPLLSGPSGLGFLGSGVVGEVGNFQRRLRCVKLHLSSLRHQWGPSVLRTHPLQNVADISLA
jgi:hypothetical protein